MFDRPEKSSSEPLEEFCRRFSLADIQTATNNFDEDFIIGRGLYLNVYKGYIDGGETVVAIKRLKSDIDALMLTTEIKVLSQVRHRHLVSVVGYCNEKGEMMQVCDYMINGTLHHHLYETEDSVLPWKQRLKICIGAAKGLHYLHAGGKLGMIHKNFNSRNILLDEKWVAKVSDYGLSLKGVTSKPSEDDFKYLAPEYFVTGSLTEKLDVYSFGVVLFEVLCARTVFTRNLEKNKMFSIPRAKKCVWKGNLDQLIDPYLMGNIAPVCLKEFVMIAMSCLSTNATQRPPMVYVLTSLESALQAQESADAINLKDGSYNERIYEEIAAITSAQARQGTKP